MNCCIPPKINSYQRGFDVFDERGALLPFLAGVLVTTPFIFLSNNKNNNAQPAYAYPMPYQTPYVMTQAYYPQAPYYPYAYPIRKR